MRIRGGGRSNSFRRTEKLFNDLLYYRQTLSVFVEHHLLIKELERLLSADQTKFMKFLSEVADLIETKPEYASVFIFLQRIKVLRNKGNAEKIVAVLNDERLKIIPEILNAKKGMEENFSIIENLILKAIEDSPDAQKNEALKRSLEKMRGDLEVIIS